MTPSVRVATHDDVAAVLQVDRAVVASGDREQRLRDAVRAHECIVCEHQRLVAGYAVVQQGHFYGRDFVELLVVAPEARRQGVGRALLRSAVVSSTTPQLFTSTNLSNTAMQALLASEEWSLSGQLAGLDVDDPELVYYTHCSTE